MEEERNYTIYMHRCPNGKCYVGMTSQNPKSRWGKQGNNYKNNKDFYSDIEKYKWDNIEHIILEEGLSREDACKSEKYNIKKYNCIFPNGYNISSGGDVGTLGVKKTKEQLIKMSIAQKERWKNDDYRNRQINALKEWHKHNEHPNKGKPLNLKTREKIEKKIICDGAIYESQTKFCLINGLNKTMVSGWMTGIRPMPKKWNNMGLKFIENPKEYKSVNQTIGVICNNIHFNSIKECEKYFGLRGSSFSNFLSGNVTMPLKWYKMNLRYDYESIQDMRNRIIVSPKRVASDKRKEDIRNFMNGNDFYKQRKNNSPTNNKKVMCDGFVFNSQLELSKYLDVDYRYINKLLNGKNLPKKWIRRGLSYFEDNIENKIERVASRDNTIELIFNGIVYDSVNSFATKNNICEASVRNWIRGKQPMPIDYYNGGLRYYNETIEERNKRVRIENKSNKLVVCDNVVYNKLKECCSINNLPYSTISKGLNSKMPQKYIDRGLHYYNPETDKDLPIYVDMKDEV